VVGAVLITLPLAATRRLRLTRSAAPFVVATGLAEVAGFACYAVGARHGIAIAAVLASQFAALSAIGAYIFFRERLSRVQIAGIVVIAVGVAVLSALRA
jgi:drug/metabolite transporter (DMT)-like permease